ncbi:MAG: response regulator transcription factor [Chloroflexota bacterium]|nr:response regulator transcription factor [Chloroflexota bacterium]
MTGSVSNNSTPAIRLLVAEDSAGTRHNLINILSFEPDIEVVGAVGSARQAIDLAIQLQPTVILMDINLPDMDGLTATSNILRLVPGVAIVIMSVHDEITYQHRALAAGASAFLVKPFSSDELAGIIRKVITNR